MFTTYYTWALSLLPNATNNNIFLVYCCSWLRHYSRTSSSSSSRVSCCILYCSYVLCLREQNWISFWIRLSAWFCRHKQKRSLTRPACVLFQRPKEIHGSVSSGCLKISRIYRFIDRIGCCGSVKWHGTTIYHLVGGLSLITTRY